MLTGLGCSANHKEVTFNSNQFKQNAGLLYFKDSPFTGTLVQKEKLIYHTPYKNGKKHGVQTIYYLSGNVNAKRKFKHGNCFKNQTGWWDNANLRYTYSCNTYGIHGKKVDYYKTGKKKSVQTYKNGKEEGKQQFWFSDGKVLTAYIQKNGRRYGITGTKLCRPTLFKIEKND